MQLSDVQSKLSSLTQMDGVIATLYHSYQLSQADVLANVILYGPPGYAKSLLAKSFYDVMGHPNSKKQQFSAGMRLQELLGMVKLGGLDEGKWEVNLSNSFLEFPVARFEEMFNAPRYILAVLIDILMSGEYCVEGNICYKSKCKHIIACTNINPSDWAATDDEKAAVYAAFCERFPWQVEVKWKTHSASDYARLIENVLHTESDAFAQMMEVADKQGKTISPRTAIIGAQAYQLIGFEALTNMKDIDPSLQFEFERIHRQASQLKHKAHWEKEVIRLSKLKNPTFGDLAVALNEISKHIPDNDEVLNAIQTIKSTYDNAAAGILLPYYERAIED